MKLHTLQVKEVNDGELFIEIPEDVIERLKWNEGDDLVFEDNGDNSFLIKKVKMTTLELDFADAELFKFMKHAHAEGLSFDQWVNKVMKIALVEDRLIKDL